MYRVHFTRLRSKIGRSSSFIPGQPLASIISVSNFHGKREGEGEEEGLFRVNDEWLRDAHSSMCLGNLTFTVKYVFRCRMRFQTRRNRCGGNWVGNLRSFSVYVRTYVRVYANFGLKFNLVVVQVLDSWISGK